MALILFAGYLKNAEVAVDALSIWSDSQHYNIILCFFFFLPLSVGNLFAFKCIERDSLAHITRQQNS
jgi:hypothetical protein